MSEELIKRILSSLILIPIALLFVIEGGIFFIFFLSIIFLATSYEWIRMSKKNDLVKILGIIFLFLSFFSAYKLKNYAGTNSFLLIILICIFTDIGGYIFGKFFKGPKLSKISPNKTYSGTLGSFILPVIASLIYSKFMTLPQSVIFSLKLSELSNNYELAFLTFILSISLISQVGDLIISYFKRLAKVKDTGKILPGHGGLLDRVDGLIFVIPFSYLFIIF